MKITDTLHEDSDACFVDHVAVSRTTLVRTFRDCHASQAMTIHINFTVTCTLNITYAH
jgi:hypothetical protein